MIVCLEGPDGSGKSTLVNYLIDKYNMTMKHSSSETKNDIEYHLDLLKDDNVVLDRYNLGEIVYPEVYGRVPKMNWDEQIDVMNTCMDKDVHYIIFYVFKRGDTRQVLENAEKINLVFKTLAHMFSELYPNVYALDISKESDQIEFFENILKEKNNGE